MTEYSSALIVDRLKCTELSDLVQV